MVSQTYENRELKVAVSKPRSRDWAMTDDEHSFRAPAHHPAKLVEIRRQPPGGGDRFAIIELYVLELSPEADEAAAARRLERLGHTGEIGAFTLLSERVVSVGDRSMVRRVVLWDATGTKIERQNPLAGKTKFLSLRARRDGKLYLLVAATPARYFDELLPELEQAFESFRVG
ncbi:MAG: hypothetical protein ACODAJ_12135 [Planctomycetota bacterium]